MCHYIVRIVQEHEVVMLGVLQDAVGAVEAHAFGVAADEFDLAVFVDGTEEPVGDLVLLFERLKGKVVDFEVAQVNFLRVVAPFAEDFLD